MLDTKQTLRINQYRNETKKLIMPIMPTVAAISHHPPLPHTTDTMAAKPHATRGDPRTQCQLHQPHQPHRHYKYNSHTTITILTHTHPRLPRPTHPKLHIINCFFSPTFGALRTVVSTPHCGCGNGSSILRGRKFLDAHCLQFSFWVFFFALKTGPSSCERPKPF